MAARSEPAGHRLRTGGNRHRAAVGRYRDRLLVGLAAGHLTASATAMVVLCERSAGVLLALFVAALVSLYVLEPDQ